MTGFELLDGALALLLTDRALAPEYAEYAPSLINMLLAETQGINNTLRASKELAEHPSPESIASLDGELPCEDELARSALMYGLAAKLIMDDGDMSRVAYFQNQYITLAADAAKYVARPVVDFYAGGGA